jgi:hypothetical protein
MKKLVFLLFALLPQFAAAQAFISNGLIFRCYSDEGGIVVGMEDGYQQPDSLVVPETVYDPYDEEYYNVTKIDENALQWGEYSIVTLPKTIVYLDEDAFSTCNRLMHVYCFATTPPRINSDGAFDSDLFERGTLHVPEEAIAAYKEASEWKEFKQIIALDAKSMGLAAVTGRQEADSRYFDLTGRRVTRSVLRSGLYIQNGKKIAIK